MSIIINFEDNTGGALTDLPNEKYQKFFAKFDEIETLKIEDWKPVHILGFFVKKYREAYNKDYAFKFNSPSPSKCFEVFQIKKLAYLLSKQPKILKDYIDWVYLNKVVKAKRRLTSISFMTHEDLINEYKLNVLLVNKNNSNIERSTLLPEEYKNIFQMANLSINTYGDLAFIFQMNDPSTTLIEVFSKLESLGFDKEILTRIV